jgi:REP element-mobilizing transposase RayT
MARLPRLLVSDRPTVYHVMSRTALPGLPFDAVDKDDFLARLKTLSRIYFTEILGFCLMDNHFHLLVRMFPEDHVPDAELPVRYRRKYGEGAGFPEKRRQEFREKWSSLPEFVRELKQSFSRKFNIRKGRRGYLWDDRYKSLVVQDGDALLNCLAYIDLNPIRAGMVERPEKYRWCSLGYHVQTGNRGGLLSLEFGHADMGVGRAERLRFYRQFVYETGAVDTGKGGSLDEGLVRRERQRNYVLGDVDVFRYRCRNFVDSGVIGTREYVQEVGARLRARVPERSERAPHRFKGGDGLCTLKRLAPG